MNKITLGLIVTSILLAGKIASAKTQIIDQSTGKEVTSAEARKLGFKDPSKKFLKIQTSLIQFNEDSVSLKKSDDVSAAEACKSVK